MSDTRSMKSLSESLGPAHGIQECQGTYRKHMEARRKRYFEGLLPVPYHHSQQPARTSTLSIGTNEFRHWLSETRFLKRDSENGSPRLYPTHWNANVAQQQDVAGMADKQFKHGSVPLWAQTLDELFPTPGENLSSGDPLTDSPVVHAREVARMTAHAQDFADKCNAGDRSLFLAPSHPGLSIFPAPSVPEIRQTTVSQIHGVPSFPGQQDVRTRMPVAEMDGYPQPSEHVSCVAPSRPGSHSTLNDTQRRGRKISNTARICPSSCSPRKSQIYDLDRIRTRPHTSRDARRRTPSAAGNI
ncbi:hypothetical protein JVU11DRAFT_4788 [Chiua virens]|nr:hypothetical protein JVU11DRAFT_4788 [Chiua virens]